MIDPVILEIGKRYKFRLFPNHCSLGHRRVFWFYNEDNSCQIINNTPEAIFFIGTLVNIVDYRLAISQVVYL